MEPDDFVIDTADEPSLHDATATVPEAPPEPRHPSLDCPHPKIGVFPYGLRKCEACGSVEGFDKIWRHADRLAK